jgi:peptidoglycan/LPS O-acetylase OafA/YrhL
VDSEKNYEGGHLTGPAAESAGQGGKSARQLPAFNGWRAISILLVLGLHIQYAPGIPDQCSSWAIRLFDGLLGVRFFFTISGFLITWLMLKEEQKFGFTSLKNFYSRRALRILPVYFACLGVLAVLQIAGKASQTGFVWSQLFSFTRNFHQTGHMLCPTSLHFWSLAVEEQFYLVWPMVFVRLARLPRERMAFLAGMILLSWVWKCIALLGCYNRHLFFLFQENSTFLYLDALAYGCLGAILLDAHPVALEKFFEKFALPVLVLSCFFLVVPEIAGLGAGVQSLAFIFLLLQSVVLPEFKPFKFLNHRWMVQIGVLSYSLYVWQQLVYQLWPFPRLWFLSFPATFAAGWLSYNFLEKPFFPLRSKFRAHGNVPLVAGDISKETG